MGTMTFLLPSGLGIDTAQELERAAVAGGPDNFPLPTEVQVEPTRLVVRRHVDESGCLLVPWDVDGVGRLMGSTATLMERSLPYHFQVELARGKVNQLRCQAADWEANGLQVPAALSKQIRETSLIFGRAVTETPSEQAGRQAQQALNLSYQVADQLVRLYAEQMFQARHQRQPRLETSLGCRMEPGTLAQGTAEGLRQALNSICLPLVWSEVEPAEASYRWEAYDELLGWAEDHGLAVTGGPLIDFTPDRLPDWLWLWERDPRSLATFMCDYVETAVRRYAGRIHSWQLTAGSNFAAVLALGEDELLWLTARLTEVARQIDPTLELYVGISQPWGEYMAVEDRTHSPFIFADTLIRSGLNLAGLDLEVVMGVSPRGSYCRDLLEMSRLLDLYTLLGVPLRVTLGYPSSSDSDPWAGAELCEQAGHWHGGFSPAIQADWAEAYVGLALCKPVVRGVYWVHLSDALPHQFPHCGLFDAQEDAKPALNRLRSLRENHLR